MSDIDISGKNLRMYSKHEEVREMLEQYGIIEKGHFEYKGKAADGTRMRGGYFVNFRKLTTPQELALVPVYWDAIEELFAHQLNDLIIVGVAMGSLALPKLIQGLGYEKHGIEYAYTEKRDGRLGIFDWQAKKCAGKHLLFIEDVCNNAASLKELTAFFDAEKHSIGFTGYSVLYGCHRGHAFPEHPAGDIYAMSIIYAPAYHKDDLPAEIAALPLKEYKK